QKEAQAERHKAPDEKKKAANNLKYGDDVKVMAQEKRFGEISSQCWRGGGHRDDMQKDVRTEHDENQSEKNPSNNGGDFHSHNVTLLIRNSSLDVADSCGGSSNSSPIENRFQDHFGFEDFARNIASGPRVFCVVSIDSFHGIGDFVHRSK